MVREGMQLGSTRPKLPVPGKDLTEPYGFSILLDFQQRRIRRHLTATQVMPLPSTEGGFVPFPLDELITVNEERVKVYRPLKLNLSKSPRPDQNGTELIISDKDGTTSPFGFAYYPLLYACGIVHTTLEHDTRDLKPLINVKDIRDVGKVDLEGKSCRLIRTVPDKFQRYFEFAVDVSDPRTIRQVQQFGIEAPGELSFSTKISYEETPHGSFPNAWTTEQYVLSTGKAAIYTLIVDEREFDPEVSDQDFDIIPPPGTRVYDATLAKDAREYVVGMNPKLPDLPPEEARLQTEAARKLNWLWLLALLAVAVMGGFVYFQRRG